MNSYDYIKTKQIQWAKNQGSELLGSKVEKGTPAYTRKLGHNLFEPLTAEHERSFQVGDGGELAGYPAKMQAVHSSSALKVVDDDGGEDVDELPKLVTGDAVCIRSMGFWKHQFSGRGHQHVDDRMLVGYLEGINFASAYFSEVVPLTDIEKAGEVLDIQGQEMRDKAEAQLFAAWLNFMNGAVDWDDDIEMEDDEKGSIPFHQIIADIENILLDPDASSTSLEQAKELAETVNEIDDKSSACEFDQEDLAEDEDEGENDVKGEEKSGVDVETPRNKKGRGKGSE